MGGSEPRGAARRPIPDWADLFGEELDEPPEEEVAIDEAEETKEREKWQKLLMPTSWRM